ncbi:nucleotide pyrophosphohydrolase [Undibacterium sp. RTI2.1]|uniref:nucleotide pyrophosphohydrolase n=1 Tax=unclassified Undibacterium TaxID=2630295 RepID=UPI002B23059E|nr:MULTISPECIES: nucleotide pyrophosphohydrolase [unclassified Undibacterium]MEB0032142.1 nucleotide pyrophosphohydrolase [Undibacterium sp. RTI2.1]MEB0118358.1 nucleotide pyrophosphohydrolase [Undibacterium sp. RTI2.2]
MSDLQSLTDSLIQFRDQRNWKQYHDLKNLIISLHLETGELLELTQWKSEEQIANLQDDPRFQQELREECADVLHYLLLIAEKNGIDLIAAATEKIAKNEQRYPVDQFYGSSAKYTVLDTETGAVLDLAPTKRE